MSDYKGNFDDTFVIDYLGSLRDNDKPGAELGSGNSSISSGVSRIDDDDFWKELLGDISIDSYEFGEEMSVSSNRGSGRRYDSRKANSYSASALSDRTRTVKTQNSSRSRGYEGDDGLTKKIDIRSASGSQRARNSSRNGNNGRGGSSGRDGNNRGSGSKPPRRGLLYRMFHLSGLSYFLFVIIVSAALAVSGWVFANDVFALNKEPRTAVVTIPDDFTMGDVADELKKAGIIEYKWLFKLFSTIANAKDKIDPGSYELNTDLDYRAIISKMHFGASAGPDDIIEVTLYEGLTMYEIFEMLEDYGVCRAADLRDAAANYDFDYDFLDPSTLGDERRLEGYLFPDTYEFYLDDDPEDVIARFLNNFEAKITENMYARAEELGYSMHEIITIASLIEKETSGSDESPYISSVIYNRLHSYAYPYLQIDATIQYILPERKDKLTEDDLAIDSPYNTYKYEGLPPTPIANPGLASIEAALYPADTDYYFYALHKDGHHEFFTNSDDFDEFVNGENYGG